MKSIRLPVAANNVEDTDTKSVGASPKLFSPMLNGGGRHRKSGIGGEPLGCLALLDTGEQSERPRAFPSTGETLPTYVKAQPTVHVHRPRAVLSSPENDEPPCEPQGEQGLKLANSNRAPKAVLSSSEDLPHAPLSSIEDLAPILSSKEVVKAVRSPPSDLLSMGTREMLLSDDASSCSTTSNREHTEESNELSSEQGNRALASAATKERKSMCERSENKLEQNGNEENLSRKPAVNRMDQKHSSLPTYTPRRPAKQVPKTGSKGNTVRVLRPWY